MSIDEMEDTSNEVPIDKLGMPKDYEKYQFKIRDYVIDGWHMSGNTRIFITEKGKMLFNASIDAPEITEAVAYQYLLCYIHYIKSGHIPGITDIVIE